MDGNQSSILPGELEVRHSRWPASQWDAFAESCNASFRCARGSLAAKRIRNSLYFFEFYSGATKIGQCAVACPRWDFSDERVFLDAIQLLPGYGHCWAEAMKQVLRRLGPGRYSYGSEWNLAATTTPERWQDLTEVKFVSNETYLIHAVDFARWPDWTSYRRAMSENVRRNAAKALKHDPDIFILKRTGLDAVWAFRRILPMQLKMFRRKGVKINTAAVLRFLGRLVLLNRYVTVAEVIYRQQFTAFAVILEFGFDFFYTEGGCVKDNGGSAWYLMTELLRQSRAQYPMGRFVMGSVEPPWTMISLRELAMLEAGMRQRQQCVVSELPSTITVFDYCPIVVDAPPTERARTWISQTLRRRCIERTNSSAG